ncbi:Histidine biosynthesis bifunctional protein hisB [Puccinia graminis f. sp. tritici]|uniref:Imidazole glycerol phosphate synthase hisHF n=1 Tax=Puccinia graminis f. sp. tritici TaxID=56615 RepID=A0A5B0NQQ8_PUCGR|nr:Histidine biosynthesis bifunctional protein hisB [Puccinia graminis f. sp. tritici]KAA1091535.1 Histidine biosynthesis bifunctional protein hisB [Puccinia graminis f. sp. tritici]
MIYLLDYGAGNVRSLANSINRLGFQFKWVNSPDDIKSATKLIFPGVGAFGPAMEALRAKGYAEPLIEYIRSGKPYMGICIGMQALFLSSEESPQVPGLGIVPSHVQKFSSTNKAVPHMGWNNSLKITSPSGSSSGSSDSDSAFYFVHSYRASNVEAMDGWTETLTRYEDEVFVSSIRRGNVFATQFHPEKSGPEGLRLLQGWLSEPDLITPYSDVPLTIPAPMDPQTLMTRSGLTKRIIACLDVRSNDNGDLVVTKGDQYDVREANGSELGDVSTKGEVRNLGKPVELARRYYDEGADEITFLNITSFRSCPLNDQPMLTVLEKAAETVFVPFCVGGGIRDTVEPDGTSRSALEVATAYFRAGADKVSIGGDAVLAVESYLTSKQLPKSSISEIARVYGRQAVVVSIDPKRVYVSSIQDAPAEHQPCVVDLSSPALGAGSDSQNLKADLGPNGERFCWYQCTIKGGRESRPVDVVQLATGVEALGAGEILLNSVDKDGSKSGFDLRLVELVRRHVSIPVIASSGAGSAQDFEDLFLQTNVEAGLAAGIFHRNEVPLPTVKSHLKRLTQIPIRNSGR